MSILTKSKHWITASERFEMLIECIHAGFKLTPLNYLDQNGTCSCKRGKECAAPGKHPRFKGWQEPTRFVDSEEKLRRIMGADPRVNWGCITGQDTGIFVIDIDAKSGGFESLESLETQNGKLPTTLTATTGGGGRHIIFKYPQDGRRIKNSAGEIASGIDVRSDRGQIAIAPSKHKSGKRYVFDARPGTIEIAEAPEWLLDLVTSKNDEVVAPLSPDQIAEFNRQHQELRRHGDGRLRYVESAFEQEVNLVATAVEHTRNVTLNNAAFKLGGFVATGLLSHNEVHTALLQAAIAIGLDDSEADATINSGLAGGRKCPRTIPEPAIDYSPVSGKAAQIDREIDDILIHRAELKQNDPEAFARLEEEEVRKAEILVEEQAASRKSERLTRKSVLKPDASEVPDPLEPCLPGNCNDNSPAPIPFSINRCSKCTDSYSMCHDCFIRIGGTRPARDKSPCRNGIRAVISKKSKSGKRAGSIIHLKCNQWHCDKCGYDLEGDYLIHHSTVFEWAQDYLDTPQLLIPSKDVKNLSTRPVDIQPAVWKVIISTDNNQAKKYANKLAKLGRNAIWYVSYYIGQNQRAFYIFLSPGFNPERLTYAMNSKYGDGQSVIAPWQITFTEFHTESRQAVSNAGRYISLSLSAWDLIDKPPGTRIRHKAVNWCRALDMPVREERTSKNTMHGKAKKSEEEVIERCERENIKTYDIDPKRIDKSYYRGFSQYLIRFMRFEFPEDMPEWKVKRFYDWLTGKEDQIKPDTDDSTQEATLEGTDRLYQPLLI